MPTMRSRGLFRVGLFSGVLSACGGDDTSVTSAESTGDGSTSTDPSTSTTMVADTSTSADVSSSSESETTTPADTSSSEGESSSSTGEPNEPPVAVDDLYVMVMNDGGLDLAADVGVLANDSDPDGDAITVTEFDAVSVLGGTVDVAADGALVFTPAAGVWGEDGFDYTIEDDQGETATAHVRLMIAPTTISLGELGASAGGFAIEGIDDGSFDDAGWSVAGGGDIDGDGRADVIVGAPGTDIGGTDEGRAFVVFGKTDGNTVALADVLDGTGGFAIDGAAPGDEAGTAVAHAGDVNGDGLADVIVGAPGADAIADDEGRAFVVFGKSDGDLVSLATLEADGNGFAIEGVGTGDLAGGAVAGGVDVNGDGLDDVVVGARLADVGGISNAGRVWVVFGKIDTAPVLLGDLDGGPGGFVIDGIATEDQTGESVAGAGDVDGDGREDIVVGVPLANPNGGNSGRAFVVLGRTETTPIDLADVLAGNGGFAMNGIAALDQTGDAVGGGSDIDGDGLCDVVVGAYGADVNDVDLTGRTFVVHGKQDGNAVALSDVVLGNGGFAIDGEIEGDLSGWAVAGAGDLDGDGLAEALVGAQSGDFVDTLAGRSYVAYGRTDTATVPLADIAAGTGGFAIDGEMGGDVSGWAIANAGDVSADGFADLIIGAYRAPGGDRVGRAYVVFGGDFDASVGIMGTPAADDLLGTDGDETIVGGDGDDTLQSIAGFDVLYGGPGDDSIVLGGPNLFRIDGGLGEDTIVLEGDGIVLDLTAFYETAVVGIEVIDLGSGGDNSLFLEARDLRALSKTSNTLLVVGDDGDQIVAELGPTYSEVPDQDGVNVWTDGITTLVVVVGVEAFVTL
jgi:hypothetical protein